MRVLGRSVFGGCRVGGFARTLDSSTFSGRVSTLASRTCRLAHAFLLLLLAFAFALTPGAAKAGDAETADVAVEIFVQGANLAGLPITPQEAKLVKQIVTCGVAGTSVGDCVRNMVVATALEQVKGPPEINNAVNCLLGGRNIKSCVEDAVVKQLPVEAQPMANCMISGSGNIADCTKKMAEGVILEKVPDQVRPLATCMIEKGDPKKCGSDFVIQQVADKLPPEAKQYVACLGNVAQAANCVATAATKDSPVGPLVACATAPGADLGKCLGNFAVQNLPSGTPDAAKNLASCVTAPDFQKCAEQNVKGLATAQMSQSEKDAVAAIQTAIKTIDKLRPDAPVNFDAGRNGAATLQNIMMVADGIKKHDWAEVLRGAGPELAKIASNIILSIFLTPAVASALGPAVEAMINNHVVGFEKALDRVANGDPVGLAGAIFEWYEFGLVAQPCALIGDKASEAICGPLSDAIHFISENAQDLAKAILSVGKDILQWLGVWGFVDNTVTAVWNTAKCFVQDAGKIIGIGDGCKEEFKPAAYCASLTPQGYYTDNYLACLTNAADAAASKGSLDTGQLTSACTAKFNGCTQNGAAVAQVCGSMADSLTKLTGQVTDGMRQAADVYTNMGGPAKLADDVFQNHNFGDYDNMCDPNFWANWSRQYAGQCASFVNGRFPLAKKVPFACQTIAPVSASAANKACTDSLNAYAGKDGLAGPNSDYCKKQKDYEAGLPKCHTETKGLPILLPDGRKIDNIVIVCDPPPTAKATPFPSKPGAEVLNGGTLKKWPFDPVQIILGGVQMPRLPWQDTPVVFRPGPLFPNRWPAPIVFKFPPATDPFGGFGGPYFVDGRSGNSPIIKSRLILADLWPFLKLPKVSLGLPQSMPKLKKIQPAKLPKGNVAVRPSGNGGGGPGSAMDRLGGVSGANVNSVSGNSGYTAPGGYRKPCPTCAVKPKDTAATQNGGTNTQRGGTNTSRSIPKTTPSAPSRSGPDVNLDYGGCSSCGKKDVPDPVR